MKRTGFWMMLVFVAAVLLGPSGVGAQDVITFGFANPLTPGDYKSGQINVQTAELFIDEINAKGGLLGKKVALVKADDEGKPAVGVTAMQRLASEKVSAIVGVWHSSVVIAQAKVIEQMKVPMLLHYTWADDLTASHSPYIYRIGPFNSEIAQLMLSAWRAITRCGRLARRRCPTRTSPSARAARSNWSCARPVQPRRSCRH